MATASVTATVGTLGIVPTLENSVLSIGGGASNPPKEPTHRLYHCRIDFNGMKCKQVESPNTMPINEWTRLCVVPKYSPKWLDTQVIRFKCMPENIEIEK
jgi:hypothetical protein